MPQGQVLASSIYAVGSLIGFVDDVREARGAVVMAVVNTTPDSFFDGGKYLGFDQARARIDEVLSQGADIIDIGAESTRPGSTQVSVEEQLDRAAPAISHAVAQGAWVSIDTTSSQVAAEALRLGARIVNDVSCLKDVRLAQVTKDAGADLILMHSRGSMSEMSGFSEYDPLAYRDVVEDVRREWSTAAVRALGCGLSRDQIWFDPGLGFHKNAAQSLELMGRLAELSTLGAGLVLGASRKSFLGALDGSPPDERLGASIAACLHGLESGAQILRVHDVRETVQALRIWRAFADRTPSHKAAPRSGKTTRDLNDTTPNLAETAPDSAKTAPDSAKTAPDLAETTRDLNDTAPDLADTAPDSAKTAPDLAETTRDLNDTAPDLAETAPDLADTAPDSAKTAPDLAETTRDLNDTAPDLAEASPVSYEGAPVSYEGAPVSKDGTPGRAPKVKSRA